MDTYVGPQAGDLGQISRDIRALAEKQILYMAEVWVLRVP